ncbi:MAG: hypothetical protein R6X19_00840 [Kiritimatiellia bacterium]
MKAQVSVEGGICGFSTCVRAEADESANVTFQIESECAKVRAFGEALALKGPVDAYAEIGEGADGVVLTTSRSVMKGCCAGCVVHAAAFKALQVAGGLALPKDIALRISADPG